MGVIVCGHTGAQNNKKNKGTQELTTCITCIYVPGVGVVVVRTNHCSWLNKQRMLPFVLIAFCPVIAECISTRLYIEDLFSQSTYVRGGSRSGMSCRIT